MKSVVDLLLDAQNIIERALEELENRRNMEDDESRSDNYEDAISSIEDVLDNLDTAIDDASVLFDD